MQLFVIRHAIAEDAAAGQDDASRALTDEGRRKLREVVAGLRELDLELDRILVSPWTRALQSAELLKPLCEDAPVITSLLAQVPSAELIAQLAASGEATAVVGHEPWLGELVAWLCFGDMRHGEGLIIKKAGVVWLEGTAVPGGMRMRALIPPRLLRALT